MLRNQATTRLVWLRSYSHNALAPGAFPINTMDAASAASVLHLELIALSQIHLAGFES